MGKVSEHDDDKGGYGGGRGNTGRGDKDNDKGGYVDARDDPSGGWGNRPSDSEKDNDSLKNADWGGNVKDVKPSWGGNLDNLSKQTGWGGDTATGGSRIDRARQSMLAPKPPQHIQDFSNRALQEERATFTEDMTNARSNQTAAQTAAGLAGLAAPGPVAGLMDMGVRNFGMRPKDESETIGNFAGRTQAARTTAGLMGDVAGIAAGFAGISPTAVSLGKTAMDTIASLDPSISGSRTQTNNALSDNDKTSPVSPLDNARTAMAASSAGKYADVNWSNYSTNHLKRS